MKTTFPLISSCVVFCTAKYNSIINRRHYVARDLKVEVVKEVNHITNTKEEVINLILTQYAL